MGFPYRPSKGYRTGYLVLRRHEPESVSRRISLPRMAFLVSLLEVQDREFRVMLERLQVFMTKQFLDVV